MSLHPLIRAAIERQSENPDGGGSGYSAQCAGGDCTWSFGIAADHTPVDQAMEDHALNTGHIVFGTVVAALNFVDVPEVQARRRDKARSAGEGAT